MTVAVSGDSITFPDNSVQATAPKVGMVNRIINGAMVIDQRNAGATTTPADFAFITDRWQIRQSTASKFSAGQSSTVPNGFSKSLLITSLSSYTVSSSDVYVVRQQIEGFNTADLGWGTANAQAVTLSFKVRSSLTGTFGGSFLNAANNRSYVFTYTINAANTFEDKAITIAGDTTGTWETGNLRGVQISFGLGVGSTASGTAGSWVAAALASATGAVSVVGTSGATFYITGVDLRKGSTGAYSNGQNDFDYRPYGTELGLCQRYYQRYSNASAAASTVFTIAQAYSTTNVIGAFIPPVAFRATPTINGVGYGTWTATASNGLGSSLSLGAGSNTNFLRVEVGGASGLVAGNASGIQLNNSLSNYIDLAAEL